MECPSSSFAYKIQENDGKSVTKSGKTTNCNLNKSFLFYPYAEVVVTRSYLSRPWGEAFHYVYAAVYMMANEKRHS